MKQSSKSINLLLTKKEEIMSIFYVYLLVAGLFVIVPQAAITCYYLSHRKRIKEVEEVKEFITRCRSDEEVTEALIELRKLSIPKELQDKYEELQNEINGYPEESQLPDYRKPQINYVFVKYKDKSPKSREKQKKIENRDILSMENKGRELGKEYLHKPLGDILKELQKILPVVETTECHRNEIIKKELGGSGDVTITGVYREISEEELKKIKENINKKVRQKIQCLLNDIKRYEDEKFYTCWTQIFDKLLSLIKQKTTK